MSELKEKIDYKGFNIDIYYDTDAESPDIWGNEDSFIVYDHRQFYVQRDGFNPDDIWDTLEEGKKLYEGYWIFPLYAYIHSGVSLSLGSGTCRWDTSMKGFALVKREAGWSYKREQAGSIAEATIKEWNEYLSGEVYGYETEGDSCFGYIGDEGLEQAIEEAKSSLDYYMEDTRSKHFNQLKAWIKKGVNYIHRQPLIYG